MNELLVVLEKVLDEGYIVIQEGGILTIFREGRYDRKLELHFRLDKDSVFFIEAEDSGGETITV